MNQSIRYLLLFLFPTLVVRPALAAVPSEYELTDITGWSEAQLATLPYFKKFVPVDPVGAGTDFIPAAHNGQGLTGGNRTSGTTWVQGSGAYVADGTQSNVSAWLRSGYWFSYSWSYTYFDGTDYHFQNGFVTHSPFKDLNTLGDMVGYATVPGSGSSSAGYADHAWILDPETGEKTDITPDATRAVPNGINDHGDITGYWSNSNGYHAFRRTADGVFTDFTVTNGVVTPGVINNHGHIAGMVTIYSTPRLYYPFFSEAGTEMTALPLPSQGSPDTASIADINFHDILVGEAYRSDSAPRVTSAARWVRVDGSWQAEDLNELLADNLDFILDRCIAINDAGYILATGHLDGGPDNTYNTHRLLLTPDVLAKPAVTTLAAVDTTSTSAVLRAVINAAGLPAGWHFEYGTSTLFTAASSTTAATGTCPVVAGVTLTGLTPDTTYHLRAVATNSEGTVMGSNLSFRTSWNWPAWAAAHPGISAPDDDMNTNGAPDLLDYATGNTPHPVMTIVSNRMTYTFFQAINADGVQLAVDISPDMVTWYERAAFSSGSSSVTQTNGIEVVTADPSGNQRMITVSGGFTNGCTHYRLRTMLK